VIAEPEIAPERLYPGQAEAAHAGKDGADKPSQG
jgi:hypothetical protein